MFWEKYSHDKIKQIVFKALEKNSDYRSEYILGLPGSNLDSEIFYDDAPFLKDAPFISSLVANPNHIGCHTYGENHEAVFKGTQEIEKDLIKICAEEIFEGEKDQQDGYVASGGTEANIEAIWIYRNFFLNKAKAKLNEIAVIYSEDSHYSIAKAINILNLVSIKIEVNKNTREINWDSFSQKIDDGKKSGIKHLIAIANLSTTMFGSIDDVTKMGLILRSAEIPFKIHVDGAFGGFIYPFTNNKNDFSFKNPYISSFTIDGHKMLQAPYGTGIFLIRKGYIEEVCTEEAQYVSGLDYTLCGSRSGANAISVWMILRTHGYEGWKIKMNQLNDKTERLCNNLRNIGISFYRNPSINIIAIQGKHISPKVAHKYFLVPDSHEKPQWYKIVIMPHVTQGALDHFISDIKKENEFS